MYNLRRILAVSCVGISLAGCSEEPPVVDTKAVLRLPKSTEYIWARPLRDEDFASLSHLQQLNDIDFYWGMENTNIPVRFSDAGLATLASLDLPHLNAVFFGYCTNVTDASLTNILKLKHVTFLGLVACPCITDIGLRTLVKMPNLTELDLRGCTNITDKGLEYLAVKSNWKRIELGGCSNITFEAVSSLQWRYPCARIKKDDWEWSYEQ